MKLSSFCCDMNENVQNRQKSTERTTSISVTLKLLQCVWCSAGKKLLIWKYWWKYSSKIFMKTLIENIYENIHWKYSWKYPLKILIENIHENVKWIT